MTEIKFNRVRAQPSKHTFLIKPIAELLTRYVPPLGRGWLDPYSGENSPAEYTNDHDPAKPTIYHLDALDYAMLMKEHVLKGRDLYEGILFDPPYSYRQVSEHYAIVGKKATALDTSTQFYSRVMNPLCDLIKPGGHAISFGWNSNGFGENRGFEIVEILLVAHGTHHNDTIVTVERKTCLND